MKRPDRYLYPAIFAFEEEGIAVTFPDLPGCNTCGDTQEEAMSMAQDALRGHLAVVEDHGDPLPGPSDIRTIQTKANEVLAFVEAWRIPLRERTVSKEPHCSGTPGRRGGARGDQLFPGAHRGPGGTIGAHRLGS